MPTEIHIHDRPEPATVSVHAAAALMGISPSSAYRAVHKGELPAFRIGRRFLVPIAKLDLMLGRSNNPSD
jgi:excisionase family DNA binding protein